MNEQEKIRILTEEFGGNLWEKGSYRRIYFDGQKIAKQQGLEYNTYNTGNISSATINGEAISNSAANRIINDFRWFKLWFDLTDGQFHTNGELRYTDASKMVDGFMATAQAAIG